MRSRGAFITLEGIDAAGKTTQLRYILDYLRSRDTEAVESREPGGSQLGEALRQLLLQAAHPICAQAELLLFFAARAQHLHQVIRPALEAGKWVVCDRFSDATYAYQGGGRGIPSDAIASLETLTHGGLQPDLTILLDLPVEASQTRSAKPQAAADGGSVTRLTEDRFERQHAQFKHAVRTAYLQRAAENPQRIQVVDAAQPLATVQQSVRGLLDNLLQSRRNG